MNKLNYLSAILSFLAIAAAILGPARIENVPGIEGITPFGWTIAAIAGLALAITLLKTRDDNRKLESEKQKAAKAEAALEDHRRSTLKLLQPGLALLYRVLDLAYLLPHLGSPEDPQNIKVEEALPRREGMKTHVLGVPVNPPRKVIRESLRREARQKLRLDSDEYIQSLTGFNYVPRRGFQLDIETQVLTKRPDVLDRQDPHLTTVPFAIDTRQFQRIVSEEFTKASEELEKALERAGYIAFDAEVLQLVKDLLNHGFLNRMKKFAVSIDRFLKVEGYEGKDKGHGEYPDPEFWENIVVSLIVSGGIAIGASEDSYRDFAQKLEKLRGTLTEKGDEHNK